MSKVKFKRYLHSNKEDNNDLVEHFDNDDLKYTAYEEELVYEYDTETKETKLIGAGGFLLGDKKVNDEDITKIEEM
jgi:hypothetical protein